jgi:signal transduction histidine kinase
MKKSIPLVANSIIFIIGICCLVYDQIYLGALCLLIISLILLWSYGMSAGVWETENTKLANDDIETEKLQLSAQIRTLTESERQLSNDNEMLRQRISQLESMKNVEPSVEKHYYQCPLTYAVPIAIDDFFKACIERYSSRLERAGVGIEYVCESKNLQTYLSSSALTIICDNVFDNILKFAPRQSKVFLIISAIDDESLIIFKNSGKGVTESEVERVFEINYKGSNAKGGNGLGLAQVKEILDDYGGSVWCKSTPDTGFALYLQIPSYCKPRQTKEAEGI